MDSNDLPTGTITFLFTDIEGSTQLWEQAPEAAMAALTRHDEAKKTHAMLEDSMNAGEYAKAWKEGYFSSVGQSRFWLARRLSFAPGKISP